MHLHVLYNVCQTENKQGRYLMVKIRTDWFYFSLQLLCGISVSDRDVIVALVSNAHK